MSNFNTTAIASPASNLPQIPSCWANHGPLFPVATIHNAINNIWVKVLSVETHEHRKHVDGKMLMWFKLPVLPANATTTQRTYNTTYWTVSGIFRKLRDNRDMAIDLLKAEDPAMGERNIVEIGEREYIAWVDWHGELVNEDY